MKPKKLLSFLVLFSLTTTLLSQTEIKQANNVDIKWGEFVKSKQYELYSVLGNNNQDIFITKRKRKNQFSLQYDYGVATLNNSLTYSNTIDFDTDKNNQIDTILYLDDKIIVFESHYDKKQDILDLGYSIYNQSLSQTKGYTSIYNKKTMGLVKILSNGIFLRKARKKLLY